MGFSSFVQKEQRIIIVRSIYKPTFKWCYLVIPPVWQWTLPTLRQGSRVGPLSSGGRDNPGVCAVARYCDITNK